MVITTSQLTTMQRVVQDYLTQIQDKLPFAARDLHRQLRTRATMNDTFAGDFDADRLVALYLKSLTESRRLFDFVSIDELLQHFELFLIDPLPRANEDLYALEDRIESALKNHPIMSERDPAAAVGMVKDFIGVITRFSEVELRNFKIRRVELLEKVFVDYNGTNEQAKSITLDMRRRMHDYDNIFAVLKLVADGLRVASNDLSRATFLKSIHSALDDKLDPFGYIRQVYQRQVQVEPPSELIRFPKSNHVRSILAHLVQNAIDHGSTKTRLYVSAVSATRITIVVEDNCPGGIRPDVLPRLGKEFITDSSSGGSGMLLIHQSLLPKLGAGARIAIESQIIGGADGSRITLTVPLELTEGKVPRPGAEAHVYTLHATGDAALSRKRIAQVLSSSAPDTAARLAQEMHSLEYPAEFSAYNVFEIIGTSGMGLFQIHRSTPTMLTLTYTLPPIARR